MCAARHARVMNIIVAILRHKLVAFKLLTLTHYASTAAYYHIVPLECALAFLPLHYCSGHFGYNNITYSMVVGMVSLISGAESGSSQSSTSGMMSPKGS
jgi:hypothetical protein